MADSLENVPGFQLPSPEELEKIRSDLGVEQILSEENSEVKEPPRHRRRGRPRKYHRDEFGRVLKDKPIETDSDSREEPLETLQNPPLSTRDAKEVAKRLSGILVGATSVGAVLQPAIQMTKDEADNIATPLTAYLVRTEATSRIARQVLNEYDIAAFVIASLAYLVRVVKDIQREREYNSNAAIAAGREPRGIPQRVETSGRAIEPSTEQTLPESDGENAEGSEGSVDRQWASTATKLRNVTEV